MRPINIFGEIAPSPYRILKDDFINNPDIANVTRSNDGNYVGADKISANGEYIVYIKEATHHSVLYIGCTNNPNRPLDDNAHGRGQLFHSHDWSNRTHLITGLDEHYAFELEKALYLRFKHYGYIMAQNEPNGITTAVNKGALPWENSKTTHQSVFVWSMLPIIYQMFLDMELAEREAVSGGRYELARRINDKFGTSITNNVTQNIIKHLKNNPNYILSKWDETDFDELLAELKQHELATELSKEQQDFKATKLEDYMSGHTVNVDVTVNIH